MRRRLRELLQRPDGEPRLVVPALVVLVLTFIVGYAAMRGVQRALPDEDRAEALSHTRKYASAEALYVRLLRERPSGKLLFAMLENHDRAVAMGRLRKLGSGIGFEMPGAGSGEEEVMSEEALEELFEHAMPVELGRVGRFWRGTTARDSAPEALRAQIVEGADRDPPIAFYNHALAREALRRNDIPEAARRYEREGVSFPDQHEDVDRALLLWVRAGDWEHVRERLDDPRVRASASAHLKYQVAVHERDWKEAARWLVVAWRPNLTLTNGAMSAVAALAWFFFCARLGKVGDRPVRRMAFYVAAFVLGVLSIVPTVVLIAVEEAALKLQATGDMPRDIIFYVFGVGLREEASKLLLFLPLLPVLRRWGDKLDVLVCGALVGLGFAAEENLNYLASGDLHTGLGRFLTANFLHMALTAVLASALDDFMRDREKHAADFSRVSLMVVAMHGGYDFLLSHEELGGSYAAMAVFFVLVRMFLTSVDHARRKADVGLTLTHAFMFALAVVTGTSAVYAVAAVGPAQGLLVLAEGLLGVAVLVYAFVKTLRGM